MDNERIFEKLLCSITIVLTLVLMLVMIHLDAPVSPYSEQSKHDQISFDDIAEATLTSSAEEVNSSISSQQRATRVVSESSQQNVSMSTSTVEVTTVVLAPFVTTVAEATTANVGALMININTASAVELTELDGIGEVLAGRIVAYREQNGNFSSAEQLLEVSGIGEKKLAAIRNCICF